VGAYAPRQEDPGHGFARAKGEGTPGPLRIDAFDEMCDLTVRRYCVLWGVRCTRRGSP
jgi:hypothetical protein